jgi:hypothetical protein
MTGKRQANEQVRPAGHGEANLGQKEAKLERASKDQMDHMEGGREARSAQQQKAEVTRKS